MPQMRLLGLEYIGSIFVLNKVRNVYYLRVLYKAGNRDLLGRLSSPLSLLLIWLLSPKLDFPFSTMSPLKAESAETVLLLLYFAL